jgi:hypothetical protein
LSMANPATAIQTASADGVVGGVINENQYAPLLGGTTRYTTSQLVGMSEDATRSSASLP